MDYMKHRLCVGMINGMVIYLILIELGRDAVPSVVMLVICRLKVLFNLSSWRSYM